jgi:hypothetical protein
VAAPRRRLPLLRLAALREVRAERRAGSGVENGVYVRGLRPEALKRQNGLRAEKKGAKGWRGVSKHHVFEAARPPGTAAD